MSDCCRYSAAQTNVLETNLPEYLYLSIVVLECLSCFSRTSCTELQISKQLYLNARHPKGTVDALKMYYNQEQIKKTFSTKTRTGIMVWHGPQLPAFFEHRTLHSIMRMLELRCNSENSHGLEQWSRTERTNYRPPLFRES